MSFIVTRQENGRPLQQILRDHLNLSGRAAKSLLDRRQVFVNGRRVWMAKHPCKTGDEIRVPDETGPSAPTRPDPIPVLHRDDSLIAVDKPPGLVTDRAPDSLEQRLRTQLNLPGLRALHRLDRETSGLVLFTTPETDREPFVELFRTRNIQKQYQLILRGTLPRPAMTVKSRMDGKVAESRFTQVSQHLAYSCAQCELLTGRTHQIRKHLRQLKCTLAGDKGYNTRERTPAVEQAFTRQMLHARHLSFEHPLTGKHLSLEAPLPDDFRAALKKLGLRT